jgi:transcriptional regulator with XRE-family HTH domain
MYNGVGGRKLREHRELKGGGSFVKTLKELRKSKGLTMGKLAELCGISAKTISLYEHSPQVRPSKKVVGKLSDAHNISETVAADIELISEIKGRFQG